MESEETIVVEEVTESPAISHEEYLSLVGLRQQVVELKAQKSDVQDFVIVGQQYADQLEDAKNKLAELNNAINEAAASLQSRFLAAVEPFGLQGNLTISDTEPHYVTVVEPAAPAEEVSETETAE